MAIKTYVVPEGRVCPIDPDLKRAPNGDVLVLQAGEEVSLEASDSRVFRMERSGDLKVKEPALAGKGKE
jgi:hypothetical protein